MSQSLSFPSITLSSTLLLLACTAPPEREGTADGSSSLNAVSTAGDVPPSTESPTGYEEYTGTDPAASSSEVGGDPANDGGTTVDESATAGTTQEGTEEPPEQCDGLDNDGDDLFDEGCDCSSDAGLTVLSGYSARVVLDLPMSVEGYGWLGDVERATGAYWQRQGEGVLFTVNSADAGSSGVGLMTQDGEFIGWLVEPDNKQMHRSTYLEYAYDGMLYACATDFGDDIYRIYPDGTVEPFVSHGYCEGIAFGDRGDGVPRLYASEALDDTISVYGADGDPALLNAGVFDVVDLAFTRPQSAFLPGLYAINQWTGGVHHIGPGGPELRFEYDDEFGRGEEFSFADPSSPFGDYFYHLSASQQLVQRVNPSGVVATVVSGPALQFGFYSTGAVFSSNGAYYYFTNENDQIFRLQACDVVGQ